MKTLICSNRKGGSTKSTIAVNVAAAYAQGTRTLLIDLDAQGDASTWLGVEESGEALADALSGRVGLEAAIRTTPAGIDVAAGGEALGYLSNSVGPDAVRVAINSVRSRRYGYVVIDCPPALSSIVLAGWRAAPDAVVLIPVDGPAALRAVGRFRNAWLDAGLDESRLRVVLTRFDRRRLLDQALAKEAEATMPGAVLKSRVRESVIVPESAGWRRPLVIHAPLHPLTEDIRCVAREVADVV
jgi:chromosome partitioning protein